MRKTALPPDEQFQIWNARRLKERKTFLLILGETFSPVVQTGLQIPKCPLVFAYESGQFGPHSGVEVQVEECNDNVEWYHQQLAAQEDQIS